MWWWICWLSTTCSRTAVISSSAVSGSACRGGIAYLRLHEVSTELNRLWFQWVITTGSAVDQRWSAAAAAAISASVVSAAAATEHSSAADRVFFRFTTISGFSVIAAAVWVFAVAKIAVRFAIS